MQVTSKTFNNFQTKSNPSFGIKGSHNPEKLLTEKTMKVISAAIASAGIAGITLQQHTNDFAKTFDKEITRSELRNIDADTIAEVMETTPILIDIILTDKASNGKTRTLSAETLKSLVETYYSNPDLTEKLLLEKNEDGLYKYAASQINNLVSLYNESPELYDLVLDNPSIKNLIDLKNPGNTPRYGADDIKFIMKAKDLNPDLAEQLMKQKDKDGYARFSGEQINYILENTGKNNNFISELLDAQLYEDYRFSADEVIELNEIAKNKRMKKVITTLMEPIKVDLSHQYSSFASQKYYMQYQLDNDLISKYAKNPDIEFSDFVKDFKSYNKEFALHIYSIINGGLNSKDVKEILSVRDERNKRLYNPYLLKQYPELFTEKANKLIDREYKDYNY